MRLELDALNVADFSETSTEGPIVALPRGSVQMIALALHELGTNAIKHGVLNGCGGALEIRWHRVNVDHPALRLEWSEYSRESIDVIAPRTGFGRVLLEKALPAQLGAITHFDLRPNGLQCVIELPLEPTA